MFMATYQLEVLFLGAPLKQTMAWKVKKSSRHGDRTQQLGHAAQHVDRSLNSAAL